MLRKALAGAICAALIASPASAGVTLPQPFQVGDETGRYDRGVATISLEQANGAVEITPQIMDHGSVVFTVVVYNDGQTPVDFDVANIRGEAGGQPLAAFTVDELEGKAKNRAMWSAIGVAVLAGAAAAAASTAYTTERYHGRMRTPHGTYSWTSSYRDNSVGVVGATAATAAGVAGIASIQGRLEATRAMLADETVQRTTVEPGSSYGGRVVLQKIKAKGDPQDVRLAIDFNGETYRFGLHLPKKGEKPVAPVRSAVAPSRSARIIPVSAPAEAGIAASAAQPIAGASPLVPNTSIAPLAPNDPAAHPRAVTPTI